MPRLSVILPAYNAEHFLNRSAGSVLSQSFTDLELIIINDGSTDGTAAICAELLKGDSRVSVINQENSGVSVSRNKGIAAANGELIAFIDADDTLEPNAYSAMLSSMDESGADCAICGYNLEYTDGTKQAQALDFTGGDYSIIQKNILLPLLEDRLSKGLFLGTIWRYIFRKSRITEQKITFSGAYLEDELFLIEYFARECSIAAVSDPLYNYLQNPNSVTRRYLAGFVETFLETMRLKKKLVSDYALSPAPEWVQGSAWAGLLIAVSNEFAPGSPNNGAEAIRKIAEIPMFSEAIRDYRPSGLSLNKSITAFCLRSRQYRALAALYKVKNRRR